jgi:chromosome segregation ATPase
VDFFVTLDGEFHHAASHDLCEQFVSSMVENGFEPKRFKIAPLDGIVIIRNGIIAGHEATQEAADARVSQLIEKHIASLGSLYERARRPDESIEQATRRIASGWYSTRAA